MTASDWVPTYGDPKCSLHTRHSNEQLDRQQWGVDFDDRCSRTVPRANIRSENLYDSKKLIMAVKVSELGVQTGHSGLQVVDRQCGGKFAGGGARMRPMTSLT